jgi:chromosome segregation ATPase
MTCALKCKETTKDGKTIKAFVVGKTRTYFRAGALEYLESNRITGLDAQAVAIQKAVRGWLVRKFLVYTPKVKQEEEEAARRAEEERLAALAAEREALDAEMKAELDKCKHEEKAMQRQIETEDEKAEAAAQDFDRLADLAKKEAEDLQTRFKELQSGVSAQKTEQDRLNAKLEANTNLIGVLRKENKKLHKSLEKVQTQYDNLTKNNKKLSAVLDIDSNAEGELEYAQTVNDRVTEAREAAIAENLKMKEDVQKEQMKYMAVAESRLELQRTLANILNIIKDKCSDATLVNDMFAIAHQCEAESKSVMDALESSGV